MKLPNTMENYLQYLINTKNLSSKTIRNYRINLEDFYYTMCENQEVYKKLTLEDFQNWLSYLKDDRGLGTASLNQRIATLSGFFSYLQMKDIVSSNIPAQIKSVKSDYVPQRTILTEKEVEILFQVARQNKEKLNNYTSYRNEMMIHLFLSLGLRIEELSNISLKDIDMETEVVSITVIGKRKRKRTVVLSVNTVRMLKDYLKVRESQKNSDDEALFLSRQKSNGSYRLGTFQIRNIVVELAEEAKVTQITPHSLRHTNATILIQKGVSLMDVSKNLGHSTVGITEKIYVHQTLESSRRVAVAFDNLV